MKCHFIYEFIYEMVISHIKWQFHIWNAHFQIWSFKSIFEIKNFIYEIFPHMKISHMKYMNWKFHIWNFSTWKFHKFQKFHIWKFHILNISIENFIIMIFCTLLKFQILNTRIKSFIYEFKNFIYGKSFTYEIYGSKNFHRWYISTDGNFTYEMKISYVNFIEYKYENFIYENFIYENFIYEIFIYEI